MTTTTATEYPGLEAKAQKVFEIPYAELSFGCQAAVRKKVAHDAAEDMLAALKAEVCSIDCPETCCGKMRAAISKAEGRQ